MNEPDTSVVEQIEREVAAAFAAKGRELALHGWRMDGGDLPRYAADPHLLTKAVFHGQLHALLAGARAAGGDCSWGAAKPSGAFHQISPN